MSKTPEERQERAREAALVGAEKRRLNAAKA